MGQESDSYLEGGDREQLPETEHRERQVQGQGQQQHEGLGQPLTPEQGGGQGKGGGQEQGTSESMRSGQDTNNVIRNPNDGQA